jgi:MOSC domain-containing protein YiiM
LDYSASYRIRLLKLVFQWFSRGTRLQLGDEAVIEITMPRTGCAWLGLIQGRENAVEESEGKLGKQAMVITGGQVRVGDTVQMIENSVEVTATK